MENINTSEEKKSIETKGLSNTVKRYVEAFSLSIWLIAGVQAWPSIAWNFLTDSNIAIASTSKTSSNATTGSQSISYEDILYFFIEQDAWLIEALREKIKNEASKSGKPCDIEQELKFFKFWEKKILSYFENSLSKWWVKLTYHLDRRNIAHMYEIFPYVEWMLKARYGENYMNTVSTWKYNLEINIKDTKDWSWYMIENMLLTDKVAQ